MSVNNDLNDKLVSELRDIAKTLGIADADDLRKPQLITAISEQQQLIEMARAQQTAMETNYAERGAEAAEPAGDKPRKRTRTVKGGAPKIEVPLDDATLFDHHDEEPQATDEEDEMPVTSAEPVAEQQQEGQSDEP